MIDRKIWEEWRAQSCSLRDAIPYMTAKYRAEGMPEHEIRNILRLCSHLEGYIQASANTPTGQQSLYSTPWDIERTQQQQSGDSRAAQASASAAHGDDRQRSSIAGSTSTGPPSTANSPEDMDLNHGVHSRTVGVPCSTREGTGGYFAKAIDTSTDFNYGANGLDEI